MIDFRTKLAHRFRKQQEFADGYSPLNTRLFELLGNWVGANDSDPLVAWLVDVGNGRSPLDITLLLLAGLHRDILNQEAETIELAHYYPTVRGKRLPDDPQLPQILRQTILARRETLAPFIQTATVQTNETARGVCWLLPLLYTGWEAVHLVDLGASAGLNLVAEARNYRLVDGKNGRFLTDIGNGKPVQFQIRSHGIFPPITGSVPHIISRTGCDLKPFKLDTAVAEQTLAAYIWADQPHRLKRLREGITAFHEANQQNAPIQLYPAHLPDELPQFLRHRVPDQPNHPVVIYNTYMTAYLDDKGASMRQNIANWAVAQNRPILWLQWEPLWDGPKPPDFRWIAWTADLWQANSHHYWHLAWNHPHGIDIDWQTDFKQWVNYWR